MIMFIQVPLGGRNSFRVSILEEEKGELSKIEQEALS